MLFFVRVHYDEDSAQGIKANSHETLFGLRVGVFNSDFAGVKQHGLSI